MRKIDLETIKKQGDGKKKSDSNLINQSTIVTNNTMNKSGTDDRQFRIEQLKQERREKLLRRKMIDLKLNYMVTHLQEKLGFVTKKHKMDHMMS